MKLAGKTILVVEDEPVIAIFVEDLLLDAGASPVVAPSLEAAEQALAGRTFEAALLDINVRGRKSYPLARLLRSNGIPFVFATGYGTALHGAEFAGVPTIAKPYSLGEIERAFARAG